MKERMINGYSVRKSYLPNITDSVSDTKESFKQLFEHYQDTETSPYLETYENFSKMYQRENNYFYLIQADGSAVGFRTNRSIRSPGAGSSSGPLSVFCLLMKIMGLVKWPFS